MKLKINKKQVSLFLVLILGSFLIAHFSYAAGSTWVTDVIGWICAAIVYALGQVLILVMMAVIYVAQYSNFIHSEAVAQGWVIVRDICNMFFVLILLVIAFATILKIENYSYKKWLPKLILMAILINFSKTICGLLIDVTQIVMLTFVNAFKTIGGGNLVDMLGITSWMNMNQATQDFSNWSAMGAYVFAVIYVIVSLVVLVTMLMMLVMRIVMIWIYIVLSPLAYLLAAFPGGQQYSSKWWSDFIKNLIVGPVLAFFIWLSFVTVAPGSTGQTVLQMDAAMSGPTGPGAITATSTGFGSSDLLIKFVISIGMLVAGLKISQEIGGAAGGMAGKGMGKLQKGAAFVGGLGTGALVMARKGIGRGAKGLGTMAVSSKTGREILGNTAASSNPLLRFTGMRALATKGLIAGNQHQKEIEEKAQKKLESLRNTKVVSRYVREGATLPMGKAMQKKAKNMMPSALVDAAKITTHLAGMSREDLAKISDPEWHSIGQEGAKLQGRALTYIQKNSDERGAYNLGRQTLNPNANLIAGTDRQGDDLQGNDRLGSYMNPTRQPLHSEEINRLSRARGTNYETAYFKDAPALTPNDTTKVEPEEETAPRGKGNLSINEFAREQSDTVAVDFDKLNVKGIDKGRTGDADFRNTRGVNTGNPALIKEIADKMVSAIDQELSQLKAKTSLTAGDTKRMDNLETAKTRFAHPESIDNLSLVNSSAAAYKPTDVKTSKIHEELHGLGYENESDVRYASQKIVDTRDYGARKDKDSIDQMVATNPNRPPVEEIIKNEEMPEIKAPQINTSGMEKAIDNLTKKLDGVVKKIGASASPKVGGGKTGPDLAYVLNSLRKTMTKQNMGLAKKVSHLGANEPNQTPLEVSVISNQIAGDLQEE